MEYEECLKIKCKDCNGRYNYNCLNTPIPIYIGLEKYYIIP